MNVLIVDDDPSHRELQRIHLTRYGFHVIDAPDGKKAWEILHENHIQVVIADWLMPNLDGAELIQRIRAKAFPHYIYTIFLTVRDSKDDVVKGLQSGADDYLTKPFDANELLARVSIAERILGLESNLRRSMKKLRELASHDSLTGLLNRRAIYELTLAELARSSREKKSLSLALLDIDHFKSVNDRFGHLVGDQALQHIAQTIIKNRRPYDWVGRWGGEEFLIVLPGTDLAEACSATERIRESVAESGLTLPDGQVITLRISAGVTSTSISDDFSLDGLIHQADNSLYRAKNLGGNIVCCQEGEN